MTKVPTAVSAYMSTIGKRGGAKGKGKSKTRSAEQYKRMAAASVAARKRKARKFAAKRAKK